MTTKNGKRTASVELEIDPAKAKAAKERRNTYLNVVQIPALRFIGFALLGMLVGLHNTFIPGSPSWKEAWNFVYLAFSYALFAWVLLYFFFVKVKRVDLGVLFLTLDIFVWITAIYYSGGDRSLLFILLLVRVADQTNTAFRRVFFFSHVALLGYLLLLGYLFLVEGRVLLWGQEGFKILLLYCVNFYVSLTARTAEKIRNRTRASMQLARDLVAQLEKKTMDLDRAKLRAEDASRAKSEFLANMSHELRTPLNHILGFTELVLGKNFGDLNQTQEEYLNDVLQSGRHLLSLINDILDLSKVEAGKLELYLSEFNPAVLLENSLVMIKERALQRRIRVVHQWETLPEKIMADERKLKQILYNLLSNAVKFTPDGGEMVIKAGWLESEGMEEAKEKGLELSGGRYFEFSVRDDGIGIRKENLEQIFKPFEQVESSASRRYGGTGLGLSLSRRLAELHGGAVWAESQGEGTGSTFRVVIPAHLPEMTAGRGA
jgi:signal transduction histidine kinase